jgi:hypothetical protein
MALRVRGAPLRALCMCAWLCVWMALRVRGFECACMHACWPGHCLRGSTVWVHARWALGCCEVARCVYEAARWGSMPDGRLAVARLHGVLACRPGPCLRGRTVWVHARRALGCCEVARCASMQAGPLFTRLHGGAACTTGAWLLRGCTVC